MNRAYDAVHTCRKGLSKVTKLCVAVVMNILLYPHYYKLSAVTSTVQGKVVVFKSSLPQRPQIPVQIVNCEVWFSRIVC